MKIISEFFGTHEYQHDFWNHMDLKLFSNSNSKKSLFLGTSWMLDSSTFSQFEKFKNEKNYLYNSITPCDFLLKNFNEIIKRQENFDVIFNTCPISSDYLNKKNNYKKFTDVFPATFTNDFFNKYENLDLKTKVYDVCYVGAIVSSKHKQILKTIRKYKHFFITHQKKSIRNFFNWPILINYLGYKTNNEKWDLLSQSKIQIASNLLYLSEEDLLIFKKNVTNDFNNYDYVLSNKVLPQIKGRVFESLATKSLLLVERDPWNTIEKWLIPNKHFIYWDSLNDLNDKIYEISKIFGSMKVLSKMVIKN